MIGFVILLALGGLFDLGLLIEKQTRMPTEFYDDRSIEEELKSN